MKNLIRVLVLVALVVVGYIIIDSIITKSDKTKMPELASASAEYGALAEVDLEEKQYSVHKETLTSIDAIDKEVNGQIEADIKALTDAAVAAEPSADEPKAAYINAIDTYKVNDRIVSVRVTSMTRKPTTTTFDKTVNVYNYDISTGKKVTLDEIFNADVKSAIPGYSEKYLLGKTKIEFYTGDKTSSATYNSVKSFLKSDLLTKDNLEVSQSEYNLILTGEAGTPEKKTEAKTDTADTTATSEEGASDTETASAKTTESKNNNEAIPQRYCLYFFSCSFKRASCIALAITSSGALFNISALEFLFIFISFFGASELSFFKSKSPQNDLSHAGLSAL